MAQPRETVSLVSAYPAEKSTFNQSWADRYRNRDAESEPLLAEKIEVKPLKSGMYFCRLPFSQESMVTNHTVAEVKTATNTVVRSIADDPLYIYRRDAPVRSITTSLLKATQSN